jgi:hypothetical protein
MGKDKNIPSISRGSLCTRAMGMMRGKPHCNENTINVFPEKELRGLRPDFHIHVFVNDLYIPMIDPHIFLQQNSRPIVHGNCT